MTAEMDNTPNTTPPTTSQEDVSDPAPPATDAHLTDNVADDGVTTIFEDPINFNAKHPLENRWTMWFDNPGKKTNQANWAQNLKNLITFDSVEDFWGVYNNTQKASVLAAGSNYHLFKEGVRPEWEDPTNAKGGKWVLPIPKQKKGELDQLWLFTLLACVGEAFPDADEVCGAVVSIRKQQDRISLWTRSALDEDKQRRTGEQWKRSLQLPESEKVGYQAHSDALRKNSSFANQDMYTV